MGDGEICDVASSAICEARSMSSNATTRIETERLVLAPLEIGDATHMVTVLADSALYSFTGGDPPTFEALEARHRAQLSGSLNEGEIWHNWIVRLVATGEATGYVQATVIAGSADVAWVIGTGWQRMGIAREAAAAMCRWLREQGATRITAHIHPRHQASAAVANACGLRETPEIDDDGEHVWAFDPER